MDSSTRPLGRMRTCGCRRAPVADQVVAATTVLTGSDRVTNISDGLERKHLSLIVRTEPRSTEVGA